jgi:hypothetical protein
VGGLDLTQRGPDLIQGVRLAHLGVSNRTWRSGLCVQGSDTFLRRSGPTDGILEYITSSVHMAPLGLPTCWGRVLFTVWLKIAARAPCLHTVVRGTPDLGYRQWPPSPPQGRERACRWGQSLIGDWLAASSRLLSQLLLFHPRTRQLSRMSPRMVDPWSSHLMALLGHARGASIPLHWF